MVIIQSHYLSLFIKINKIIEVSQIFYRTVQTFIDITITLFYKNKSTIHNDVNSIPQSLFYNKQNKLKNHASTPIENLHHLSI